MLSNWQYSDACCKVQNTVYDWYICVILIDQKFVSPLNLALVIHLLNSANPFVRCIACFFLFFFFKKSSKKWSHLLICPAWCRCWECDVIIFSMLWWLILLENRFHLFWWSWMFLTSMTLMHDLLIPVTFPKFMLSQIPKVILACILKNLGLHWNEWFGNLWCTFFH